MGIFNLNRILKTNYGGAALLLIKDLLSILWNVHWARFEKIKNKKEKTTWFKKKNKRKKVESLCCLHPARSKIIKISSCIRQKWKAVSSDNCCKNIRPVLVHQNQSASNRSNRFLITIKKKLQNFFCYITNMSLYFIILKYKKKKKSGFSKNK